MAALTECLWHCRLHYNHFVISKVKSLSTHEGQAFIILILLMRKLRHGALCFTCLLLICLNLERPLREEASRRGKIGEARLPPWDPCKNV
jgi:hypothetical protein